MRVGFSSAGLLQPEQILLLKTTTYSRSSLTSLCCFLHSAAAARARTLRSASASAAAPSSCCTQFPRCSFSFERPKLAGLSRPRRDLSSHSSIIATPVLRERFFAPSFEEGSAEPKKRILAEEFDVCAVLKGAGEKTRGRVLSRGSEIHSEYLVTMRTKSSDAILPRMLLIRK